MNKTEVSFPSSDTTCQLYGDLTLPTSSPSSDGDDGVETAHALLPAIVIVNGSGVSYSRIDCNFNKSMPSAYLSIIF